MLPQLCVILTDASNQLGQHFYHSLNDKSGGYGYHRNRDSGWLTSKKGKEWRCSCISVVVWKALICPQFLHIPWYRIKPSWIDQNACNILSKDSLLSRRGNRRHAEDLSTKIGTTLAFMQTFCRSYVTFLQSPDKFNTCNSCIPTRRISVVLGP